MPRKPKAPLTSAEKQRRFVEAKKRDGLAKVSNCWAPRELHDKVREFARKISSP